MHGSSFSSVSSGWVCPMPTAAPTTALFVSATTGVLAAATTAAPAVSVATSQAIASVTNTAAPTVLPAYARCDHIDRAVCTAGTACFRNNNLYSECRPSCPPTWSCETDSLPAGEQCGGKKLVRKDNSTDRLFRYWLRWFNSMWCRPSLLCSQPMVFSMRK
jgi:hypothetical protein